MATDKFDAEFIERRRAALEVHTIQIFSYITLRIS